MEKFDAVVLGAGLAGLVAAYELKKNGRRVIVVEKSGRAGGVIRSERRRDGFLLEHGPNTVLSKPEILSLVSELGLAGHMITSRGKTTRFVQFQSKLCAVPPCPGGSLISIGGFLRAMAEPFV